MIGLDEIKRQYTYEYADRFAFEDDEDRHLWLNEDVTDDLINTFVYSIFRYNKLDKDVPPEKRKPIIIYINTPGGSVSACFSLIDAINTSKTPIYTVNLSCCYSAGFLIFISGHQRYALPNSTFLMHDGSSGAFWESSSKLRDRITFEEEQVDLRIRHHIAKNSNITDEFYDEQYRVEWYFYPEEAKQYEMVDYIVGTDCSVDDIL